MYKRTFNKHIERLNLALKGLENANLKWKPSKFLFGQYLVTFPKHNIGKQ